MSESHISPEKADLYALGTLDAREREQCDLHAARCESCANALAMASGVVEALELRAGVVPAPISLREGLARPSISWAYVAGLVASIAIALILSARVINLASAVRYDDVAFVQIVHSHFNHAPFIAQRADAPSAKVLFAQDGSWLLVVVDRPETPLTIEGFDAAGHASELARIGKSFPPRRTFVRPSVRLTRLELREADGEIVSRANLVYRK